MRRKAKLAAVVATVFLGALITLSGVASQEQKLDPTKLAPTIYESVLENNEVRVLKVTSRPGETPPVHSHPDRVLVSVNGCVDDVAQEWMEVGEVARLSAVTHGGQTITSIGECIFIKIELKSPSGR